MSWPEMAEAVLKLRPGLPVLFVAGYNPLMHETPRTLGFAACGPSVIPQVPRTSALELSVLPRDGGQTCAEQSNFHVSGAEGDRTPDLCSAIAALSQLSYSPEWEGTRRFADSGRSHPVPGRTGPADIRAGGAGVTPLN